MVNWLGVELWISMLPSVAAAIIPSLTAVLLMYQHAFTTARKKIVYLGKEVDPLIKETMGWSLPLIISREYKWPPLDRIRMAVREHRRFPGVLSFIPKSFAIIVEESHNDMRLLMQEQEKIHAEIRGTPQGQQLGERFSNLDQKIDEVLASLVIDPRSRPNPEVNRLVRPLLEKDQARLDRVKRYSQLLDRNLGGDHGRIKYEWEAFLRKNYVYVPT